METRQTTHSKAINDRKTIVKSSVFPPVALEFLYQHGFLKQQQRYNAVPLTGGVSSDIWHISTDKIDLCLKMALPQLKVEQHWAVPIERNQYEVAWFKVVQNLAPDNVPKVLASDSKKGVFVMEYLDEQDHPNWKQLLLRGKVEPSFGAAMGELIADIHNRCAYRDEIAQQFPTDKIFYALRPSAYFLATAQKHPLIKEKMTDLVSRLMSTKISLVHGDISPKNILCGPKGPVILDAEGAWYGDPAFDIAFCLNHLLLKALYLPDHRQRLLATFDELNQHYFSNVEWEEKTAIETRTTELLVALMLARVDGKSPAEYLSSQEHQDTIRQFCIPRILNSGNSLYELRNSWATKIEN